MDLEQLSHDMTHWRQNRRHSKERIPKKFWLQAIELSKTHGVRQVAKAIKVHTTDLKKRIENPDGPVSHPTGNSSKKQFAQLVPPPANDQNCQFEIEYNGITIRIFK